MVKLSLVSMPWQSAHRPSLPLGLLAAVVRRGTDWEVTPVPAYLDWLRLLLDTDVEPPFDLRDHDVVTEESFFFGVGDWVFTDALFGPGASDEQTYDAYVQRAGGDIGRAGQMRAVATRFVDTVAERVLADEPTVVGCTSTFMQNVASLALLQRIKQLAPEVTTMMGGANCDGPMGAAMHAAFPFVDLVVRGEGEPALTAALAALTDQDPATRARSLATIPGLCWRGGPEADTQAVSANPMTGAPWEGFRASGSPDHDPHFAAVEHLGLRHVVRPELVFEGSRGCWWGEKHHCTFCGLNGTSIQSRSRPSPAVFHEIATMVERYGVHDLVAVDNILTHEHRRSLLPMLAEAQLPAVLHYEVKSNLDDEDIALFAAAGIRRVQTGMESLITPVLTLMRKGVTATHNVRTLRQCQTHDVAVSWNLLYGFPGERPEDYEALIEQMPKLWHLRPPAGAFRITLERFSPNFEDPSLGFVERRPAGFYHQVYPGLSEDVLSDLVYLFDTPDQGLSAEVAAEVAAAVDRWQAVHAACALWWVPQRDRDLIHDGRQRSSTITLEDPLERELFRAALNGTSRGVMIDRSERAAGFIERWAELGLLFEEGERFVGLPVLHPRSVAG